MPLLDHFRPPLTPHHTWESFHSNWATRIADALNDVLPPEYLAEEHTSVGSRLEIDIATYEDHSGVGSTNGVATALATYAPPAATAVTPLAIPDSFQVRVFATTGGLKLVGVIEIVSPGNKDRPEERRAFAAKAAGYLHQGISLIVVDIVTTRHANLHNELMQLLSAGPGCELPTATPLYAVAYRPVVREERTQLEMWSHALALGEPLPTLPLRLTGDSFVPIELESSYREACERRRIG